MRLAKHLVALAALLYFAIAAPVFAEDIKIITGSDIEAIIDLAKGYGSAAQGTDSDGDPKIDGRFNGIGYTILFYSCDNHKDCKSIQFHAGFELNKANKVALSKINSWNKDKRWGRAYLDKSDDPILEMDVPMRHGMPRATLDAAMTVWTDVLKEFSEFIGYKGGATGTSGSATPAVETPTRWASMASDDDFSSPVVWADTRDEAKRRALAACKRSADSPETCGDTPASTSDMDHIFTVMCCNKPRHGCAVGVDATRDESLAMVRKVFDDAGFSSCKVNKRRSAKTGKIVD